MIPEFYQELGDRTILLSILDADYSKVFIYSRLRFFTTQLEKIEPRLPYADLLFHFSLPATTT